MELKDMSKEDINARIERAEELEDCLLTIAEIRVIRLALEEYLRDSYTIKSLSERSEKELSIMRHLLSDKLELR